MQRCALYQGTTFNRAETSFYEAGLQPLKKRFLAAEADLIRNDTAQLKPCPDTKRICASTFSSTLFAAPRKHLQLLRGLGPVSLEQPRQRPVR